MTPQHKPDKSLLIYPDILFELFLNKKVSRETFYNLCST